MSIKETFQRFDVKAIMIACIITIVMIVFTSVTSKEGINKTIGEQIVSGCGWALYVVVLYVWLYYVWGRDKQYSVNTSLIWAYLWRYWLTSIIFTILMVIFVKLLDVHFSHYQSILVLAFGLVINMSVMLILFGVRRKEKLMQVVALFRGYWRDVLNRL